MYFFFCFTISVKSSLFNSKIIIYISNGTYMYVIVKYFQTHPGRIINAIFLCFSGVDQYLAVLDPLEYNAKVTRGVSRKLISSVWILGFSAAAIASSQLIWASDYSPWISCREAAALSVRGNNNKDTTTTVSEVCFFVKLK